MDAAALSSFLEQIPYTRELGLSRNETAFQMLHKLRSAMLNPEREPLHGDVEVDETFVGGRTRKGAQKGRTHSEHTPAILCPGPPVGP